MKCLALGLSTSAIVFFAASEGAAQPPPSPSPPSAETPAQPPAVAAPNPAAPNPAAPNTGAPPTGKPAPTQTSPYGPYGYPSYGYPYANGWGPVPDPPKELAYNGGPIPNGYRLEERYSLGLLIAGPTLFALGYAVAIFTANEKPGNFSFNNNVSLAPWDALYIPITGPFAFSGYAPKGSAFIYIFEGLAQVCGVALVAGAVLAPKTLLVRHFSQEAFVPTLHIGPGSMQVEMRF